ncbi:MAG: hypothetical protein ACYDA3_13485 [Gaiellaceae bacterium]
MTLTVVKSTAGPPTAEQQEQLAAFATQTAALRERGDALRKRTESLHKTVEETEASHAPPKTRLDTFFDRIPWPDHRWLGLGFVATVQLVVLPFMTPTFAVGWWLPWTLFMIPQLRNRLPIYPHRVVIPFAWLITCALFAAAVAPAQLPSLTLTTRGGQNTSGVLIAQSGTTWYIGKPKGEFVGIDKRDVLTATVTPVGPHHPKLIFQYLK